MANEQASCGCVSSSCESCPNCDCVGYPDRDNCIVPGLLEWVEAELKFRRDQRGTSTHSVALVYTGGCVDILEQVAARLKGKK